MAVCLIRSPACAPKVAFALLSTRSQGWSKTQLHVGAQGVDDPEKKRKIIGGGFIRVFDEFATKLKTQDRIKPRFLVQVSHICCQACLSQVALQGAESRTKS